MRVAPTLLAAVLALAGTAASLPSHADGPPLAHTGGFGEPTCIECHIGYPLNLDGGSLTVRGLPAAYRPGAEYTLTVALASTEMAAAGFELSTRFSDGPAAGRAAGTLLSGDARVVVRDSLGVTYAHHTPEGSHVDDPDLATWTLRWTAPSGGAVEIHVAANSANGDNSPLDDLVYTFSGRVAPGG